MECVYGKVLTESGFEKGYIVTEAGIIKETGKTNPPIRPKARGYIIPRPINAHTHLGDAFIRKRNINLPKDIEKLVAPPHGLKHVLLESADRNELIQGIREMLADMEKLGIAMFCDFREGGIEGVQILKGAMSGFEIKSKILSRPRALVFEKEEISELLEISDGIGLSSISDWNYEDIKKISDLTRRKKKIFAIHASERVREDIDKILDLKPSFLVHMNKATLPDLERIRDEKIPVVVCPRSNAFFGFKPNLELLKKADINVSVGTDNAMIADANIYDELRWIKRNFKLFSIEEILRMITYNPMRMFNIPHQGFTEGAYADFVVLDTKSLKPISISVSRADEI